MNHLDQTATTAIRRKPPQRSSLRLFEPRRFNKRCKYRFTRNREAELFRHLGRPATYPEKIIISRIIRVEWELKRTDAKLDEGKELSGHDIRGRLAAENRLRLDLVALGLQPGAAEPTSPIEALKHHLRGKAS